MGLRVIPVATGIQVMRWILLFWIPVFTGMTAAQPVTPPPIAAKAFILVDTLSGKTLAAGAEGDRFEPASLTKVMTAYVVFAAMRAGELDAAKPVTVSEKAALV
jgi:D-alanyl-D-alanine carboxypeptidase (penicillin-binding protein 5/6)